MVRLSVHPTLPSVLRPKGHPGIFKDSRCRNGRAVVTMKLASVVVVIKGNERSKSQNTLLLRTVSLLSIYLSIYNSVSSKIVLFHHVK